MALAQNIAVIPARRKVGTQKATEQVQKTRVAAYCRVYQAVRVFLLPDRVLVFHFYKRNLE